MAAKGYWIARLNIRDPDAYQHYAAGVRGIMAKLGARFVVRGGTADAVEGPAWQRVVVIEFPDYATALACYRSDEYARVKRLRAEISEADVVIVEGYDGPQPTA